MVQLDPLSHPGEAPPSDPDNPTALRLDERREEIEQRFGAAAKRALPAVQNKDFPTLLDHLPELLEAIARHLRNPGAPVGQSTEKRTARKHGIQRAKLRDFTMEQVLAEYRILRKAVFEVLERDGRPVPPRDRDTILDLIQLGAKHAASQFMHARVLRTRFTHWVSPHPLAQAATGAVLVAIATIAQWRLRGPLLEAPYAIYYTAVILASFVSDGLLVTLFSSVLAQYFFLAPALSLKMSWPSDFIRMGLFVFNGLLISVIIQKLRRSQSAAAESSSEQEAAKHEVEAVNRKLETEQQVRDQFVNTLSHDLRSPLTTIKMSSQMLALHPGREEGREKLYARIHDCAERIDHMIQDLLDVSRIRAGEALPLTKERCALSPLIEDLVDELRLVHGDRFVIQGDTNIEGDWSCAGIRRIVENLAANAVKYGAPNRPITIGLHRAGAAVRLSVHNELLDSKHALTDAEIRSLFQPFRRTKEAEESGKKGWGLGLTLVKGLAEAQGGKIDVESSAGKGTTFIVTLPS